MLQLLPLPETTECFLVLFLESMSIYMVEFLKRTAGHRGRLHTFLLKSTKFLGITGTFTNDIKVDRDTETLACARIGPATTADLQEDLMVTGWESP